MVRIEIDGAVPESIKYVTDGILDGWFPGFWWLPKSRGHLTDTPITYNLQNTEVHTLRLTVLNITNSESGTFKFDFTAIACKMKD
eukprot:scaffold60926_cov24-Attheya_sp.AAC.1